MLANSESVVMLNQFATDREALAELFRLSTEEQAHITNAPFGHGLLRFGENLSPFELRFPSGSALYQLMSTKPGETI